MRPRWPGDVSPPWAPVGTLSRPDAGALYRGGWSRTGVAGHGPRRVKVSPPRPPPMPSRMFVSIPTRRPPSLRWATPLLCAVLWAVFLWASTRPEQVEQALMARWGALTGGLLPGDLLAPWGGGERGLRLLSALFVHADWAHLLGNLVFLLIFGLPAVRVIDTPDRLVIGASGAVSALIGAYLALFPRAHLGVVLPLGLFLEFVRAPASLLIGIWALLQVVFAYIGPAFGAVAWSAHAVGFVVGVVFALSSRRAIAGRLSRQVGY